MCFHMKSSSIMLHPLLLTRFHPSVRVSKMQPPSVLFNYTHFCSKTFIIPQQSSFFSFSFSFPVKLSPLSPTCFRRHPGRSYASSEFPPPSKSLGFVKTFPKDMEEVVKPYPKDMEEEVVNSFPKDMEEAVKPYPKDMEEVVNSFPKDMEIAVKPYPKDMEEVVKEAMEVVDDGADKIGRRRRRKPLVKKFVPPTRVYSDADDERFMREALVEAAKAAEAGEVPVGAVLVHKNNIIARHHNRVETDGDPTSHAEMLCIRSAAAQLGGWRLSDVTLYVTLEPCPMCAGAILQSRVGELVWGARNSLLGADGSWIKLFPEFSECEDCETATTDSSQEANLRNKDYIHPFHRTIAVRRGLLADESADMMQSFFQMRRLQTKGAQQTSIPMDKVVPWTRASRWFPSVLKRLNLPNQWFHF